MSINHFWEVPIILEPLAQDPFLKQCYATLAAPNTIVNTYREHR